MSRPFKVKWTYTVINPVEVIHDFLNRTFTEWVYRTFDHGRQPIYDWHFMLVLRPIEYSSGEVHFKRYKSTQGLLYHRPKILTYRFLSTPLPEHTRLLSLMYYGEIYISVSTYLRWPFIYSVSPPHIVE